MTTRNNHSAGAVAEERIGFFVVGVHDAAVGIRSDDQRVLGAGGQHRWSVENCRVEDRRTTAESGDGCRSQIGTGWQTSAGCS